MSFYVEYRIKDGRWLPYRDQQGNTLYYTNQASAESGSRMALTALRHLAGASNPEVRVREVK